MSLDVSMMSFLLQYCYSLLAVYFLEPSGITSACVHHWPASEAALLPHCTTRHSTALAALAMFHYDRTRAPKNCDNERCIFVNYFAVKAYIHFSHADRCSLVLTQTGVVLCYTLFLRSLLPKCEVLVMRCRTLPHNLLSFVSPHQAQITRKTILASSTVCSSSTTQQT